MPSICAIRNIYVFRLNDKMAGGVVSVYVVNDVVGKSTKLWEDEVKQTIETAAKTVKELDTWCGENGCRDRKEKVRVDTWWVGYKKISEGGCSMKKRSLGIVLLVVFIGMTLGGCGCFMEAKKGETPPPPPPAPTVQPAPAPACPACPTCPPAVVCPPEKVCPTCPACPAPPPKKDRN